MTERNKILQPGDVLRMEVSPQYAMIKILPNSSQEGQDRNFPRNLHNAAELFLKCGLVPNAVKLKECTDQLLELYQKDPTKLQGVKLGRGCICWHCGYVGIPKEYSDTQERAGPCFLCSETNQINWVKIVANNNKTHTDAADSFPWIERAEMTEEEKMAELAAKRAAVEARVAEALKERDQQQQQKQDECARKL
jgi:hypothetical protein